MEEIRTQTVQSGKVRKGKSKIMIRVDTGAAQGSARSMDLLHPGAAEDLQALHKST